MEYMDIPKTPPPPYQTLPPTPAASVHAPAQIIDHQHVTLLEANPSHPQVTPAAIHCAPTTPHTCMSAYGMPPRAYPRYHGFPLNLPYRPGIHRCAHPIPFYSSARPAYYAHVGGDLTTAAASFTPPPQQQQYGKLPFLQRGSISATLNDAGNLAVEAYDALVNSRSTSAQYRGVMDAVALRLDDVLTSIDDGTYRVSSDDIG
jgi:hypothetical protein